MTDLVIVGAGSQARYVIEVASRIADYRIVGLVDVERGSLLGKEINGVRVTHTAESALEHLEPGRVQLVAAYGDNQRKRQLVESFSSRGFEFPPIVSPNAYLSAHVSIGRGCLINPNVTIMPNAKIHEFVIIHSGCVIEHDNVIEPYANIGPGVALAGNVTIGAGSYVFTGASVIPKCRIGANAVVGAGSVVICDVPPNSTVAGCPAKPL